MESLRATQMIGGNGERDRRPTDIYPTPHLIAFKDAGGSIVDAARYIPGLGWECCNWEVPQGLITHWLPLPEAPEGNNAT